MLAIWDQIGSKLHQILTTKPRPSVSAFGYISAKPIDRLCQQIDSRNCKQGLFESDPALNLLSICHQVMQDFARFLLSICWYSISSRFCYISGSNLLTMSDNKFYIQFGAFLQSKIGNRLCLKSVFAGFAIRINYMT